MFMSPLVLQAAMRSMTEGALLERTAVVRRGRKLEYFTIAWNAVEGLVAIGAGMIAGSISLVGFGIDSFIEVTSGSVLLWRMSVDVEFVGALPTRNGRFDLSVFVFYCWPLTLRTSPLRTSLHAGP